MRRILKPREMESLLCSEKDVKKRLRDLSLIEKKQRLSRDERLLRDELYEILETIRFEREMADEEYDEEYDEDDEDEEYDEDEYEYDN